MDNMDNKDVAKRWFSKGNNDLIAGNYILTGFLTFHGIEAPKIHGIEELISMCKKVDPDFSKLFDIASDLSGYAVEVRYPMESDSEITIDEAQCAIDIAEKIKKFVLNKLNSS